MANVGPTKWYVDSVNWAAMTAWSNHTAVAGELIKQATTPTVGNERAFVCIVAGATGAVEPVWVVTKGAKNVSSAATYQECTGQPGVNGDTTNSPTWPQNKNTAISLGLIIFDNVTSSVQICSIAGTTGNGAAPSFSATAGVTTVDNTVTWTSLGLASGFGKFVAPHARMENNNVSGFAQAGDAIYTASSHAQTVASTTVTLNMPGTQTKPNLIISVNKAGAVPPGGADYLAGASIATTTSGDINWGGSFRLVGFTSNAASAVRFCASGSPDAEWLLHCKMIIGTALNTNNGGNTTCKWEDTTVKLPSGFGGMGGSLTSSYFEWINTTAAVDPTSGTPNTLFNANATENMLRGVDLGAFAYGSGLINVTNSNNWTAFTLEDCKVNASLTLMTAGGITHQNTSVSLINVDSGATGYRNEWHSYYGDVTTETTITRSGGASDYGPQNVSHKYVSNANASPNTPQIGAILVAECLLSSGSRTATVEIISSQTLNNNDVWSELEYEGSNASPLSSFVNSGLANPLSTAAAQTASSATWRSSPPTPVTQKLQVTFTPAAPGNATVRILVGKPSTTLYIDPVITIV